MEKTTKKTATKSVDAEKKVTTPKKAVTKKTAAAKKTAKQGAPLAHGVGRRKSAVARVWVRLGKGSVVVNEREFNDYFDTDISRKSVQEPFVAIKEAEGYDVTVNVEGGGTHAQADAVKLGFARALLTLNEGWRSVLRKAGLLTVDSRQKERKKYGQRGARRKFQFVKR